MQLYFVTDAENNVAGWESSESNARKAKRNLPKGANYGSIEVPTKKAELIEFLKLNAVGRPIQQP